MAADQEIELKLALPPARTEALARWMARHGEPTRHVLSTRYYDTPDGALRARGVALRLRRDGRRWLQTVKTEAVSSGGLSSRGEFETPTVAGRFDWSRLPEAALALIPDALRMELVCRFETRFERLAWLVEPRPGTRIEVALDVGEIVAGKASAPLCEVELELKAGAPAALIELAMRLAARFDGLPLDASKAARGAALMRGVVPAPVSAGLPRLAPDCTLEDGFVALCRAALAQFEANLPGVLNGDTDPEYVHQARIGLRRLRSTLRLFRTLFPLPSAMRSELGVLNAALGPARDADVLALETVPPIVAALPAAPAARLADAATTHRRKARRAMVKALRAARPGKVVLDVHRWLHARPWRAGDAGEAGTRPLAAWARKGMTRRLAALGREASQTGGDIERRHALRIRVKRVRYALEGIAGLWPEPVVRPLLTGLKRAQDALGRVNDWRVARAHLEALPGLDAEARAFAAGWLAHAAQSGAGEPEAELLEVLARFAAVGGLPAIRARA